MMHEMDGMFGMKLMHRMDVMHGMFEIQVVFFVYMKVYVMDGTDAWGGCMGRMPCKKENFTITCSDLVLLLFYLFCLFPFFFSVLVTSSYEHRAADFTTIRFHEMVEGLRGVCWMEWAVWKELDGLCGQSSSTQVCMCTKKWTRRKSKCQLRHGPGAI